MNLKDYIYTAPDGVHFPDARVGEEKLYEIDLAQYLDNVNDELTHTDWTGEEGALVVEEFVNLGYKISKVKLRTMIVGSFTATCNVYSVSPTGIFQVTKIPMIIKVV